MSGHTAYYQRRREAEDALDKSVRRYEHIERECIRCQTEFTSTGPHDRMCIPCKAKASGDADCVVSMGRGGRRGGAR